MGTFVIGITGASGAPYATRLIEALASAGGHRLHVIVSRTGRSILRDEAGIDLGSTPETARDALLAGVGGGADIRVHGEHNLYASVASGSVPTDAMVVIPCSMKAVSAIAHGHADTLITRAADVHLKEGRPLILVPRETPLSTIHLQNLLALSRVQGVRIVPAMPAFYHRPQGVMDLVDFVVARVLYNLGLDMEWGPRWQGGGSREREDGPD